MPVCLTSVQVDPGPACRSQSSGTLRSARPHFEAGGVERALETLGSGILAFHGDSVRIWWHLHLHVLLNRTHGGRSSRSCAESPEGQNRSSAAEGKLGEFSICPMNNKISNAGPREHWKTLVCPKQSAPATPAQRQRSGGWAGMGSGAVIVVNHISRPRGKGSESLKNPVYCY